MVLAKDGYLPELTSRSQIELQKFSKWFHKNQGDNWPTVIGGWAVWSYHNKGFGSRDADIILPTDNFIEHMMKTIYFPGNGFQKVKIGDPVFGEPHWGKPIDNDIILFDLISAETSREDSVNMGVEVDWNWVYEVEHPESIGDDAYINVPELELLITLKIIGCISRSRKLLQAEDKDYFLSKIWKDCYDVGNLTTHLETDDKKLIHHFSKTHLEKKLIQEFLEICDGQNSAFEEGNSKIESVEKLLVCV